MTLLLNEVRQVKIAQDVAFSWVSSLATSESPLRFISIWSVHTLRISSLSSENLFAGQRIQRSKFFKFAVRELYDGSLAERRKLPID